MVLTQHRFVLLFCAALLLATPLLEAGHQHDSGIAQPDCVQCHFEGGQAIQAAVSTTATYDIESFSAPRNAIQPVCPKPASLSIRGPPSIAS